jgi:Family of unknown function (DUF5343)
MAVSLPYLASNKNVPTLFDKIASAKVPDNFSQSFLHTTLGLKGSNDRPLIPLLRNLGFLDQSNAPTANYKLLKGDKAGSAIAQGIKTAYSALFDADQGAHKLQNEKLKSLVAQVAGTDDAATARIASTFSALIKAADFETPPSDASSAPVKDEEGAGSSDSSEVTSSSTIHRSKGLRPEFHYNIQVHLPANGSEEVYLNIFNALRKVFQ